MTQPNPPQALSWQVTGSLPATRVDPGGNVVEGRTVSFTTGRNGTGSVFVPGNVTEPDAIRAVIAQAAGYVDMLNSLTSGG